MAKGGGGEGHFDERRRAARPKVVSGYADSPEVLSAITKPRSKPTVVVKKKKVIAPSRVKTDSNSGEPAETGTRMTTTNLNVGRLKPQNTGFVSPAREPTIRPQNIGFANLPDFQTPDPSRKSSRGGVVGFRPPGGGKSLFDWIKGRTAMKNLDT